MSIEPAEALCPGCSRPADEVSGLGGWRFYCRACAWGWGHPQAMSYEEALDARVMAQAYSSQGEAKGADNAQRDLP